MQPEELKQIIKEAIREAQPQKKMTLTLEECVKESGIGRSTILELVHAENTDFPYFRVGKKIFINREKLALWLDRISEENRTLLM
ncbi:excisionase [Clostridium sp. DMHC 10]|uniref:excisionase n=1 Tax=Clostridium sp. DMHC 10 TaxID=747377 RepID=UPI00069DFCA9|nr:excisionase [Clostridium sp. DMHC 10]KOF56790.1 excisionase [Clostridium sp. DMHC 10]